MYKHLNLRVQVIGDTIEYGGEVVATITAKEGTIRDSFIAILESSSDYNDESDT